MKQLLRGSNMLRGSSQKGEVKNTGNFVYVLDNLLFMSLIHCGFSVCLFLTLNTWMVLKLGLLFIYIYIYIYCCCFQFIIIFVPMLLL